MDTLKPCPFCKKEPKTRFRPAEKWQNLWGDWRDGADSYDVFCRGGFKSHLITIVRPTLEEAVIEWNLLANRATPQPGADVSGLVEALERQSDNMAFVLNHIDVKNWCDKFTEELAQDRAVLAAYRAQDGREYKLPIAIPAQPVIDSNHAPQQNTPQTENAAQGQKADEADSHESQGNQTKTP